MKFKKKLLLLLSFAFFPLHSQTQDSFESMLLGNDRALSFEDEFFFNQLPDKPVYRAITKQQIIDILIDIGAIPLLQESLYCHTNRLKNRSLLDLPIFEPYCCTSSLNIGGYLFWNQTELMQFIPDKTRLDSYLALSQESLLSKLENTIGILLPLLGTGAANIDVATIFCLFKRMGIQDRRVGAMFDIQKDWSWMKLRALLPLYYQERNFFLLPRHQVETEEVLGQAFGFSDAQSQETFQKDFLISDRIGLGDLRIELTAPAWEVCDFCIDAGAMFTIPTAFTFTRGLAGSGFHPRSTLPTFDFDSLLDLVNKIIDDQGGTPTPEQIQFAFAFAQDFMLGAMRQLSANVLESKTGNNGHFGIGAMARTYTSLYALFPFEWTRHFSLNGRYSIEYLAPANETHFYAYNLNKADFRARNFMDASQEDSNLAFLEQELVKRFYPVALKTRVQPGFIFRWSSKLCYDRECWGWYIGSDTYIQSKDHLKNICAPRDVLGQLNVYKARQFHGYQGKLFAGILGKVIKENHFWLIGINGDTTYTSHGLGQDTTLALSVEAHF